ncbi:hypothetical protein [Jannaschia seosinensis]|nr:hypothetical protein [Jannaschia seosinensis]
MPPTSGHHQLSGITPRRYMPVEKLTAVCNDPDVGAMIAAQ